MFDLASGRFRGRVRLASALMLVSLFVAGCESRIPAPQPRNKKDTVPLFGEIFLDGEPGWGVVVTLNPKAPGDMSNPTISLGEGDQAGRFAVRTYGTDDGAPPGEYILTFARYDRTQIRIGGGDPPDLLQGRFADHKKSTHTVTIPETMASVDLGRIELQTAQP